MLIAARPESYGAFRSLLLESLIARRQKLVTRISDQTGKHRGNLAIVLLTKYE